MYIQLGEKIRTLRKSRNISQEVLAQYLGVSFQAVSKWENGDTMPDVALIPALASFFEVSTDELFSFNLLEQEEKVSKICEEAAQYRFSDPKKSEQILRDGLKQYPGNEIILNNLLYTMRSPERSSEVISICKSILEITRMDEVKYDVLRILAETYREMGQNDLTKETLEKIPELYFSKLGLVANLLSGDDAMRAAKMNAGICRDDLLDMLSRISELYRVNGDAAQASEYAKLTEQVYSLFASRNDFLAYQGHEPEWLEETVFPRIRG